MNKLLIVPMALGMLAMACGGGGGSIDLEKDLEACFGYHTNADNIPIEICGDNIDLFSACTEECESGPLWDVCFDSCLAEFSS